MDFIEIRNVYVVKMIIKSAKRIFNSDKICRSYSDLNFGITFLEHSVYRTQQALVCKILSAIIYRSSRSNVEIGIYAAQVKCIIPEISTVADSDK